MKSILDYTFDPDRLILYKLGLGNKTISAINAAIKSYGEAYEQTYKRISALDSDNMRMNKVEIDSMGIMPTYNCNLRCQYCAYSSGDKSGYTLKMSDIKVFVDDIIKRRTIKKLVSKQNTPLNIDITGGGEPTYEWDLLQSIVLYVKEKCENHGIPYILGMTTNGMLTPAQIDFIGKNFTKLMISYDGLPEIHNRNRISPSVKDPSTIVEHAIQELSQSNMKLTLRTTIWQEDFPRLREMYRHVASIVPFNGRIIWSVYPTQFQGRAVRHMKILNHDALENFMVDYAELVEEHRSGDDIGKITEIKLPLFIDGPCDMFCGAPSIVCPWLLPDNTITTCVESPVGRVTIGKIEDGVINYYDKYSDMLLKITQQKYVECRGCVAFYFCRGGCPMWHLRDSINGEKPQECNLQTLFLRYAIEAALKGTYSFGWALEPIVLPEIPEIEIHKLIKREAAT